MTVEEKRQLELDTMEKIISLYCRHKHQSTSSTGLCPECLEVWQYARDRINGCPHMATKTFCSVCKTHCYEPVYREKVRAIMRYGGPRLLLQAPVLVLKHMYISWRDKRERGCNEMRFLSHFVAFSFSLDTTRGSVQASACTEPLFFCF